MDRANHSKSRVSQYLFVGIGLTLLYIAFRGNEWKGSGSLHSAMEVFATLLALIVGVLSLKKYYDSRESKYLVIGAGFLGTSVLDGYHALVTSSAINVYLPSSWDSLIGWSWIASRLFLGVLLFFSYIVYRREQNLGVAGRIFPKVLYLFIGLMTAISFVFFVIVPLPRAYYPEYIFHRPEEFLPAFFFFLALVGYLKKGEWKFDSFEHWLVLSLVINVVSQVVFMSFSGAVFDFEFDVAHSLKKVSYICVLIGLVLILKRSLNEEPKEFVVDENLRLSAFGAKLSILVTSLIIFSMFIVSIVFFQDKVEAQRVQENELLQKDLKIISKLFKDDVERLKDEVVLLKNMPPVSGIVRALNNNGFDEQGNSTIAQWKGRLKNIFKQYSLSRQSVESVAYWRVDREAEILVEVSEGKSAFRPFGHLDVKAFKTEMDVKVAYFDIIDEVVHSVVAVPVFDGKELFGIVALESKKNDIFDDIRNHLPKHQKLYIFDNDQKLVVAGANKHNEKLNSLTSRIQKKYLENKNPVDSVSYLSPAKSKAFSASKLELGRDYSYNFLLFTNYELIHRSTQGSISKVLLTGGIVLVFSLVILWFIAYTLTSPLMYMSETVKAYAETGQLLDLPDKSTDEIGILARAFKDSVDQVNRTIQDLETQTYALNEHSLISMTDTLGKIIYANDKFCDVSQYSLDELLGKDHRVLNSGTHSTAFMKTLWETIKGGGVWQGELCNKAKDGSLYWVDATILGYKDLSGEITKFVAIRTDITTAKENELNLRESKKLAEISLQDLETQTYALNEHSLISITDTRGKIIYANDKFCDVSQYSLKELLGKDHRVLNSGTHSTAFMKTLWETIKGGGVWQGELCNKAKDGSLYWVDATILGYKDLSGEITKFVAIRTDITAAKENELNLKESKKLAEKARLEAQSANDSKSQFLANMSHEIRTPLNAVIGYTEILMEEDLSFEQLKMMGTVNKCSVTLLELINDILDLSKIEAGEMSLEKRPTDIIDLIYQVNEQSRPKIHDKNVELHVQIDKLQNFVILDSIRTKQVLINLLGNAVKFTQEGHILTKLEVLEDMGKALHLRLAVTDTGIGIPSEQLENIFSAFKQADGSITRKFGGTGLGLNISRKLIEMMSSKIIVESEIGKGTTFYFDLKVEKGGRLAEYGTFVNNENIKVYCYDPNSFAEKTVLNFANKHKMVSESFDCENKLKSKLQNDDYEQVFVFIGGTIRNLPELGEYQGNTIAMLNNIDSETIAEVRMKGLDSYILKPMREQDFIDIIIKRIDVKKKALECRLTNVDTDTDGKVAKILLVEDNKVNQKLCMKVLMKMGHFVLLAENGLEALEMLEENEFDVILMDMQMPVMDGLEASKRIRASGNNIPIVALTANVFESDRQACAKAGMNDFATKPFQKNIIQKLIDKYIH